MEQIIAQHHKLERDVKDEYHKRIAAEGRFETAAKDLQRARELLSQQQQTEAALRGEIVGWKAQAESKDREILALKGEVSDKSTLVISLQAEAKKSADERQQEQQQFADDMLKLQDKLLSNTQYYIERAAKLGVPKGNFVQGGGAATVEAAEGVDGANQAALAQQLKDAQDKLASVQHELESANEMLKSVDEYYVQVKSELASASTWANAGLMAVLRCAAKAQAAGLAATCCSYIEAHELDLQSDIGAQHKHLMDRADDVHDRGMSLLEADHESNPNPAGLSMWSLDIFRQKFGAEIDTAEEAPTGLNGSFTTASGKVLQPTNEALAKARAVLGDEENAGAGVAAASTEAGDGDVDMVPTQAFPAAEDDEMLSTAAETNTSAGGPAIVSPHVNFASPVQAYTPAPGGAAHSSGPGSAGSTSSEAGAGDVSSAASTGSGVAATPPVMMTSSGASMVVDENSRVEMVAADKAARSEAAKNGSIRATPHPGKLLQGLQVVSPNIAHGHAAAVGAAIAASGAKNSPAKPHASAITSGGAAMQTE